MDRFNRSSRSSRSSGIFQESPFAAGNTIVEGSLVAVEEMEAPAPAKPRWIRRHSGPPQPPRAAAPPRPRTWPAVLTLFFLAPLTAEVLTGSTPILVLLTNPFSLVYLPALYGSGAILAREAVRRRRLGWPSILLLGAAYGILEEGLITTSWFNPYWPDVCNRAAHVATGLCDYSRVWSTNLVWALTLTAFHAACSIAIPILLTERLFPRQAADPWLGQRAIVGFLALLGGAWVIGVALFAFVLYQKQGYTHPPFAPYLGAAALAAALVWLALHLRPRVSEPTFLWTRAALVGLSKRRIPRAWTLRFLGFASVLLYFALPATLQARGVPYPITLAAIVALLALLVWRVVAWSRQPGWGSRQELALAAGALSFFILLFDPMLELAGTVNGKLTHGTALVALVYLAGLIWLSLRAWREYREALVAK